MAPPVQKEGLINTNAPIKSWRMMYHPFGSLSECEQMRQAAVSFGTSDQAKQMFGKMFKSFGESQVDTATSLMLHSMCVSSDDPRLTAN
jgi:hypothetical protein